MLFIYLITNGVWRTILRVIFTFQSLDQLTEQAVPKSISLDKPLDIEEPLGE